MSLTKEEITEQLLKLNPIKYSVQETRDFSYFFTLVFESKTIFVEYFYEDYETVSNIF